MAPCFDTGCDQRICPCDVCCRFRQTSRPSVRIKGSPAAVSTNTVADFRGLGVSIPQHPAGLADFYSSDDAGADCPDGFATPAHFLAEKADAEADGNVTPIERAKRNLERAQENLGGMFARAAA